MDAFLAASIPAPDTLRRSMVTVLGHCHADGKMLEIAAELAHWNVGGPCFGPLHKSFGNLLDEVRTTVDRVAEKIVAMGALIGANLERLCETARIPDYPVKPMGQLEHVREVTGRLELYIANLRSAVLMTNDPTLIGVNNMLAERVDALEQHLWMLQKHLEPEAGASMEIVTVP